MSLKFGFFLGCIMPNRYPGIESSTRAVLAELGIELVDLEGASCCPAPGVTRSFNQDTWLTIGARNLAIAEAKGVDIITVCNGCYGSLFDIAHILHESPDKLAKVNETLGQIGMKYGGGTKVRHFADVLHKEVGVEKIMGAVKSPQENIKAAIHYGCHFLSPSNIKQIDNTERPTLLDELVEAVGAASLDYKDKRSCCGAGGGVRARSPEVAEAMTKEKLANISKVEANAIIDVCPFCHLQYDRGQKDIGGYEIPVLHLSQLYGMALGLDKEKLGYSLHEIKVNL